MHIQVSINQVHIRKSLAANSLLRFLLHPCKNEGLSLPSLPSQLRFRSLHNNQQQSVYLGEGTFASQKSLTYQMSLNFYNIYIYQSKNKDSYTLSVVAVKLPFGLRQIQMHVLRRGLVHSSSLVSSSWHLLVGGI